MRLLLAEDERELSRALAAILKHNNYTVDAVYDGMEALDYLESSVYDGVILDVMMPKLDGIGVIKELRKRGSNVPVLMLTAKSETQDKVLGLDSGADDYLTKPFETEELLARIRSMTRRVGVATDNVLRFGSVSLDRSSFVLSTPSGSVRLNNKEFQMMETMLTNPSSPVSVDRFMEKIWGWDAQAETNVVWVYISNLRKKLQEINADIKIVANRNVGYYLEKADV